MPQLPSLDRFFRRLWVEVATIALIALASVAAVASVAVSSPTLEVANLVFSGLFALELSLRWLGSPDRRRYWSTFWIDWVATVPWELLVLLVHPAEAGAASLIYVRLLRLPRLVRLLRFVGLRRSPLVEALLYQVRKQLELSIGRQLLLLSLISVSLVAAFGFLFTSMGVAFEQGDPYWFSLLTLVSSDSIYEVHAQPFAIKALVMALAFGGMVLFNGVLIAIIVTKASEALEEMKAGWGPAREKGHIVLLGWSDVIPHILRELELAAAKERSRMTAVLLVPRLSERLRGLARARRFVEVVVRAGNPCSLERLRGISLQRSRAVVVYGDEASSRTERSGDARVIKTYITLHSLVAKEGGDFPTTMLSLADMRHGRYLERFKHPNAILFDPYFFGAQLLFGLVMSRHTYAIYSELFSFEGSEFYLLDLPDAVGRPFAWVSAALCDAIAVGLVRAGETLLVPDAARPVMRGDRVVALARDRRARLCVPAPPAPPLVPPEGLGVALGSDAGGCGGAATQGSLAPQAGAVVIVGSNHRLPHLWAELSACGVATAVLDDQPHAQFERWWLAETGAPLPAGLDFRECRFRSEDEIGRALARGPVRAVIVLADTSPGVEIDAEAIDADTLFRVMQFHHLRETVCGGACFDIIVEILSPESEEVVVQIPRCTYVLGAILLAKLMTMCVLQPELLGIFRTIVRRGEVDLCIAPPLSAAACAEAPSFGELAAQHLRAGAGVAIGYVRADQPRLNPPRDAALQEGDEIVLLLRTEPQPDPLLPS